MKFQYYGATIKRVDTSKGLGYRVWLPGSQSEKYAECGTLQDATRYVYFKCGPGAL